MVSPLLLWREAAVEVVADEDLAVAFVAPGTEAVGFQLPKFRVQFGLAIVVPLVEIHVDRAARDQPFILAGQAVGGIPAAQAFVMGHRHHAP